MAPQPAWEGNGDDATGADSDKIMAFHLTGDGRAAGLQDIAQLDLRPALLAAYRDLSKLRHDFPLVLVDDGGEGSFVRTLSGLIDEILQTIAARGMAGERLRKQVLGLEREIRGQVAAGAEGSLRSLWSAARKRVLEACDEADREALSESLSRARVALTLDGEVIDCDRETPARLHGHAWRMVEAKKARRMRRRLDQLALKLAAILKADFLSSEAGRTPEALKDTMGTTFESEFDFEAMSEILPKGPPQGSLSESRRQRLRATLAVLEGQKFFAPEQPGGGGQGWLDDFVFERCGAALGAVRERGPEMAALVKAMAIAELEIDNRYDEARHDGFFAGFEERALAPADQELFPAYLVCLDAGGMDDAERASLIQALTSGLPIKVLMQSDDILGAPSPARFAFGAEAQHLTTMAVGLGGAFVLQSSASNLYQSRERILAGMRFPGPALFSVFSGATGHATGLPPYLIAAAAMQSRAFPTFSYDPSAGTELAARARVDDNPQAERAWPRQTLGYEDRELRRHTDDLAFTFVDFVAGDGRYAGHFARVPQSAWDRGLVAVGEYLRLADKDRAGKVPYVLMVDGEGVLHRVVVAEALIQGARRCAETWRGLQELGGIDNSHARHLLERERERWEEQKAQEIAALRQELATAPQAAPETAPEPAAEAVPEAPDAPEAPEPDEAPSDEPSIETPRCTTCDECTNLNNRMFAYDDDKQAYIADLGAGTYRDMVEAAEACQVAIIHPGKPWNPDEPGLEELVKRAEAFV